MLYQTVAISCGDYRDCGAFRLEDILQKLSNNRKDKNIRETIAISTVMDEEATSIASAPNNHGLTPPSNDQRILSSNNIDEDGQYSPEQEAIETIPNHDQEDVDLATVDTSAKASAMVKELELVESVVEMESTPSMVNTNSVAIQAYTSSLEELQRVWAYETMFHSLLQKKMLILRQEQEEEEAKRHKQKPKPTQKLKTKHKQAMSRMLRVKQFFLKWDDTKGKKVESSTSTPPQYTPTLFKEDATLEVPEISETAIIAEPGQRSPDEVIETTRSVIATAISDNSQMSTWTSSSERTDAAEQPVASSWLVQAQTHQIPANLPASNPSSISSGHTLSKEAKQQYSSINVTTVSGALGTDLNTSTSTASYMSPYPSVSSYSTAPFRLDDTEKDQQLRRSKEEDADSISLTRSAEKDDRTSCDSTVFHMQPSSLSSTRADESVTSLADVSIESLPFFTNGQYQSAMLYDGEMSPGRNISETDKFELLAKIEASHSFRFSRESTLKLSKSSTDDTLVNYSVTHDQQLLRSQRRLEWQQYNRRQQSFDDGDYVPSTDVPFSSSSFPEKEIITAKSPAITVISQLRAAMSINKSYSSEALMATKPWDGNRFLPTEGGRNGHELRQHRRRQRQLYQSKYSKCLIRVV